MAISDTQSANGQNESERLADRGLELYETRIKPQLEPAENGRYVAIHVESGEYDVASTSPEALRALRKRLPTGYVVTLRIGNEPEYALAARLLAGEMQRGAAK